MYVHLVYDIVTYVFAVIIICTLHVHNYCIIDYIEFICIKCEHVHDDVMIVWVNVCISSR